MQIIFFSPNFDYDMKYSSNAEVCHKITSVWVLIKALSTLIHQKQQCLLLMLTKQ